VNGGPVVDERALRERLRQAGLTGSFLVRDLRSGAEVGLNPDREFPIASLVKVAIAVAVLVRVERGELDGARPVEVAPGRFDGSGPGPGGLSRFRHPARVAVDDLVYLSTAVSDNTAADALLDLVPPAQVDAELRALGLTGITVRHPVGDLLDTPADNAVAHALAVSAGTPGHGHPIRQLDVSRANTATARALTDLLAALWTPSSVPPPVAARLRELLAATTARHRLAPDFSSDAATWSSRTGTLLNLRHEIGVVEHDDGDLYAIAALTESTVPAAVQPAAEAAMSQVARTLHGALRAW
jgi:beta-lactamase class A